VPVVEPCVVVVLLDAVVVDMMLHIITVVTVSLVVAGVRSVVVLDAVMLVVMLPTVRRVAVGLWLVCGVGVVDVCGG